MKQIQTFLKNEQEMVLLNCSNKNKHHLIVVSIYTARKSNGKGRITNKCIYIYK